MRDDAVGDAKLEGALGVDHFGGEVHLACAARADEALKEERAAVITAEPDVLEGGAEARAVGDDADIAAQREAEARRPTATPLTSATVGLPIVCSRSTVASWFSRRPKTARSRSAETLRSWDAAGVAPAVGAVLRLCMPLTSPPAQKPRPLPVSAMQRTLRSRSQLVEVLGEQGHELAAHGVEAFGAVERDKGYAIGALLEQRIDFIGQGGTSGVLDS